MKRYLLITVVCIISVTLLYATWSKGRELRELREHEESFLNGRDEPPVAIVPTSALSTGSSSSSDPDTAELLQLRGEVVRLELRKKDLLSARTENERLKAQLASLATNAGPELPADYIRASQAQDRGFATPQATLETFFWAGRNRNVEKLLQCFPPEKAAQFEQSGVAQRLFEEAGHMPGARIKRTTPRTPDIVMAQIEFIPGMPSPPTMTFRLINGEWKLDSL